MLTNQTSKVSTIDFPDPIDLIVDDIPEQLSNVVIDLEYTHAHTRHPEDASVIRKCMAEKGPYMTFKIDQNRYLRTCIISENEGLIGFQIVDIIDNVAKEKTAYIKDRIRSVHELLRYVSEKGYSKFVGPL